LHGGLWVEARAGVRTFPMWLNTGANTTSLSPADAIAVPHGRVFADGPRVFGQKHVLMRVTRLRELRIGHTLVQGLPIHFLCPGEAPRAGLYTVAELGNSYLEKFRVTLDFKHERLRLDPLTNDEMDEWTGPGLDLGRANGPPLPRVNAVVPNSPAYTADIRVGDKVTAVDQHPTANVPLWILHDYIRGAPGTNVVIAVRRDGERRVLRLRRTRLL
jgi:membrane-associated protease RseP (regulator of RpoE activity)